MNPLEWNGVVPFLIHAKGVSDKNMHFRPLAWGLEQYGL